MKTYGEAAREMACAVYTVRNYKISNAPLAANAALRMACAVEDGRNYKISNAPLAANAARGMVCAIYKTKKYLLIVSKLPIRRYFFTLCIAYFIIPIDIVGYKSYNPIMFVGIIGFII